VARSETLTKLPLDRWAAIMGIDSRHFNGVVSAVHPPRVCEQPWFHYSWQSADRVGREELAQAISNAEADMERELGYRLLPSWEVDEWQAAAQPWRPDLFNLYATDVRGFSQSVKANWGHVLSGGIRATTLIDDDVAITYSDEDGDSYAETATIAVAVDVGTSPCELHVYYPEDAPLVGAGDPQWEIRPIVASVSGAVATIRFRREQAVLANLQHDLLPPANDSQFRGLDGAVDANFLTAVDVYRVYNDPQTQISFLWEPFGTGCEECTGGSCTLCAYVAQTGCLTVRGDPRLGLLSYHPGSWDAATSTFTSESWAACRSPDLVRLYYYAGFRDKSLVCPTIRMAPEWERAVAYYAAALLDRPICECNNVGAWVAHWQRDLAVSGRGEGIRATDSQIDNPFGSRRGMVYAWEKVKRLALGRPVLA